MGELLLLSVYEICDLMEFNEIFFLDFSEFFFRKAYGIFKSDLPLVSIFMHSCMYYRFGHYLRFIC